MKLTNNMTNTNLLINGKKHRLVIDKKDGYADLYEINQFGREDYVTGYRNVEDFKKIMEDNNERIEEAE